MRRTVLRKLTAVLLAALFFCGPLSGLPTAMAAVDYSWVKVKLTTNNATALTMYVNGSYFIAENGVAFDGGTLTVRAGGGALTVNHSVYGDIYSGRTCSIKRARVDRTAGYLSFNSRKYLGHFNLKATGSGYIQVVNEVPMAQYLYGVVGYEMSDFVFGPEALKAQAIAAKGYVMCQFSSGEYYIGDTSADQVYKGYNASYTGVISAVDSTISEVLTVNGSVFRTFFAASNGGETNLPTYAWPSKNYTNGGFGVSIDPYDLKNTYSPCETVKIPINTGGSVSTALYNFIATKAGAALGSAVTAIDGIYAVSTSGEANPGTTRNQTTGSMTVGVRDAAGMQQQVTFTFRLSELYANGVVSNASLRIYWGEQIDANQFYIYHLRYGHGVGLSQRGAQQRATEGQNYQQILSFYYPGAQLISTAAIQQPQDPVNSLAGTVPVTSVAPTVTQPPATGGTAYGMINYDDTNYRSGPGTSYPSYGKLNTGVTLTVYGESGNWYDVEVGGRRAYVYKQYVDITGYPSAAATPAPAVTPAPTSQPIATAAPAVLATGALTSGGVNFRTGPNTSSRTLGKFDKGDVVQIFAQEGAWYYVSIQNTYGYVSTKYVKVTQQTQPVATAAPTAAPVSSAATLREGMLTTGNVNLRSAPSTASTSLRKLSKNTAVTVVSENGGWYYVLTGSQYGYVYAKYVKITGTAQVNSGGSVVSNEAAAGSIGAGTTTGSVNMRKGPATTYGKVTTLSRGTALTLYGQENGWYKASTPAGKSGYVSGKYVTVTAAYATGTGASTAIAETAAPVESSSATYGETVSKVNFRAGPATSAKKLGLLPKGTQVILYALTNGWFEAGYNNLRGYISAEYVKVGAAVATTTTATTATASPSTAVTPESAATGDVRPAIGKTTGDVNFRTRPATTNSVVISLLPRDTAVQILGKCGEWYYVLYGNKTGFLSGAYLSVTQAGTFGMPVVTDGTAAYSTYTKSEVNMRKGPATSYAVIQKLSGKTPITVFILAEGWCLIRMGSAFGFVSASYVELK